MTNKTIAACSACLDQPNTICKNRKRKHINGLRCGRCHYVRPTTDYDANRSRADGYAPYCKACQTTYPLHKDGKPRGGTTDAPPKDPNNYIAIVVLVSQEQQSKFGKICVRRFLAYRKRSKKAKRKFDLTLEQFSNLTNSPCQYCGQYSRNKNYCGIDRVDSLQGYYLSNCVPCCDVCNKMKLAYTVDFFLAHIRKIATHAKG